MHSIMRQKWKKEHFIVNAKTRSKNLKLQYSVLLSFCNVSVVKRNFVTIRHYKCSTVIQNIIKMTRTTDTLLAKDHGGTILVHPV